MRRKSPKLTLAALLAAVLAVSAVAPLLACGIYIPREGDGGIVMERALLRWQDDDPAAPGGVQDIVMELTVDGGASEAAWILPVPTPATVQIADAGLFDELEEITAPQFEVHYFDPNDDVADGAAGGAPGPAAVTVLERQSLGPFDVTSLTASDAGALADWLAQNGYTFPEGFEEVIAPYVEQGWAYVALALRPGSDGGALDGALDPLWLTFAADELVYPFRPSALRTGPRPVYLYVLADTRVEYVPTDPANVWSLPMFAGFVEPGDLAADAALRDLLPRRMFLTKILNQVYKVEQVRDDFTFAVTDDTTPYRETVVRWEPSPPLEVFGQPAPFCSGLALPWGIVLAAGLFAARRRRIRF